MKVWTSLRGYNPDSSRPLVLAMGNFDGVHRGHQAIVSAARVHAGEIGGIAAVLTFSEHPQRILHPGAGPPLLTSPQHRLLLFSDLGLQTCFLLPFTADFSRIHPADFVRDYLVGQLHVCGVHLGYNAHFGFNRGGDVSLMKDMACRHGFKFFEAKPVSVNSQFVSSSLIRKVIAEGRLEEAAQYLGRPFSIFASVVRGKGRGRALGYPTANLQPHSEILPPRGVYPVEVRENRFHLKPTTQADVFEFIREEPGQWQRGVLNYGVRPTFESQGVEIPEVHLLDAPKEVPYGTTLETLFYPRLREERQFKDSDSLRCAVQKDVSDTLDFFAGKKCGKEIFTKR